LSRLVKCKWMQKYWIRSLNFHLILHFIVDSFLFLGRRLIVCFYHPSLLFLCFLSFMTFILNLLCFYIICIILEVQTVLIFHLIKHLEFEINNLLPIYFACICLAILLTHFPPLLFHFSSPLCYYLYCLLYFNLFLNCCSFNLNLLFFHSLMSNLLSNLLDLQA